MKTQLFSHRFTQMNADRFKYKKITGIILRVQSITWSWLIIEFWHKTI